MKFSVQRFLTRTNEPHKMFPIYNIPYHHLILCAQGEKAVLKAKAERDREVQTRACIAVPLVEEKEEDVRHARTTLFTTGSSGGERKRKRFEIRIQPVFGGGGTQSARQALLKAQVRMDRSVFSGSSRRQENTSVKDCRTSLGIRTSSSSSACSSSS